jgi:hypothetical protein
MKFINFAEIVTTELWLTIIRCLEFVIIENAEVIVFLVTQKKYEIIDLQSLAHID